MSINNPLGIVTDFFEREIKVGDLLIYSYNFSKSLLGQVTGITKMNYLHFIYYYHTTYLTIETEKIGKTLIKKTESCLLVNEFQLDNFYKDIIDTIIANTQIPLNIITTYNKPKPKQEREVTNYGS